MSSIIKSDAELRTLIPNVLATVEGESTFYDKLSPFLESAEFWITSNFVQQSMMYNQVTSHGEQQTLIKQLAVLHAFLIAIPNLDLVLTPNGFGIVSNSNVAPASKERVERLIASIETQRDNILEQYLRYTIMYCNDSYLNSAQGKYFFATLSPT